MPQCTGMEGMDPGSGAGMTGWGWVTMKRWHYRAAPRSTLLPNSAQGERPHAALGWIYAYAG